MKVPEHPSAGEAVRFIRARADEVGVEDVSSMLKVLKAAGIETTHARVYNCFSRRFVSAESVPLLAIVLRLDDTERLRLFDLIAADRSLGDADEAVA